GGVTAGNVTGNGSATITLTGTINQVNATLAAAGGLTYTPTANYNGADRVQITTNDGGATGQDPGLTGTATTEQDQDGKTISVTAVNDPVTGAAPPSATVAEDSANVAISGLSISDVDAALNPAGVYNVTVSSTNGTMTLTTLTGLTFTSGDGTSDSTMTFHGTLADINTALATAKYTPAANYNGAAPISLNATDTFGGTVATGTGSATADSDTIDVTVNAVNDTAAVPDSPTIAATEQVAITINSGLTVSDVDLDARNGGAGDYGGASFLMNRSAVDTDDLFTLDTTGALFTIVGTELFAGGLKFGSFSNPAGMLNVNFNSLGTPATTALVNDVLRHIQYTNTSNTPDAS